MASKSAWSAYPGAHDPIWKRGHGAMLAALALTHAAFTIAQWSPGYIDFGDGNYMYISWRLAQGTVIYRDILCPQPPCHLFAGAAIVWIARLFHAASPLYFFRAFSLLLHLANGALVARLAWRAWGRADSALAAAAIYIWLPIGYFWSLGYQSEPLEIFFLLLMMGFALRGDRRGDIAAGIFAALSALTNATAAPFLLVLIIYIAIRAPRRALLMTAPCLALACAIVGALEGWTHGAFLQTAVLNQVGTFPQGAELLRYGMTKILNAGKGVMAVEGAFVTLALIAVPRLLRRSPMGPVERGGLAWFCLATLGSLIYVLKGGTEDYIFSLAEPAVAILAAGEITAWLRRGRREEPLNSVALGAHEPVPSNGPAWAISVFTLSCFALLPAVVFLGHLWNQDPPFELPAREAAPIIQAIEQSSRPGDQILAPPFYAFMAGRRIWQDYSELFIWRINYLNDRRERNPQGKGWSKATAMAAALRARAMPIVIIELNQQGQIPEIMNALQEAYRPLRSDVIETNNTRLGVFVPVPPSATADQKRDQQQSWRAFKQRLLDVFTPEGVKANFSAWFRP